MISTGVASSTPGSLALSAPTSLNLLADVDSLAGYAGIHAQIHGFHRMLARRFPYAIYYRVIDDVCVVYRILDCRRNPGDNFPALR